MTVREIPIEQVLPVRRDVMYPGKSLTDVSLTDDPRGTHLGLFDNGQKLVTVVSLFMNDNELQFRKFATLIQEQGKGYGSQMLKYILAYSKAHHVERIWCNARKDALQLYKRFGFAETGECFSRDGIDFVIVELFL
ncbi:GNAT family N-acetyltransferase [Arcticibacter sp.]|uniref:GNAT family N-acetyltransferase n=1 Tax=Arcticibacter sp. TaxID=1872630 RepID=UPI003890242A